MGNYVVLIRK